MEQHGSPRKLAAILIADAVGFSRQMGADDERALRVLLARRNLIEEVVARHHGRVFGEAGDSVAAEFASAVDALAAALDAQSAIVALNREAPEAERMSFRIGINLGDVIVEDHDLFGDGVNVAERLQVSAEPDGICISGSIEEQVRDKFDAEFVDLGTMQFKNIARPMRVFLVRQPGGSAKGKVTGRWIRSDRGWWAKAVAAGVAMAMIVGLAALYLSGWQGGEQPAVTVSGPPTVAVLPFANLSGDSAQDYFSDGVTEDIVAALGRFQNLFVLAHRATARFKNSTADPSELRQQLGVRYIVIGSVRRSGDRIRVSVDLTDTDTNRHLWSRQFDRSLTDLFTVQTEITRDITGALAIKLTRIEQDRAFAKETRNLQAYDLFLQGRTYLALSERSDVLRARALFESAIDLDPRYAAAISALGETYQLEATMGWTEFVGDSLKQAEALARKALDLSPDQTDARQLLAFIYLARGEYDRAITETNRAIEINPSDAYGYAALGATMMWSGDAEEAIAAIERAKALDPTLHRDFIFALAFAYYLANRYEDAVATFQSIAAAEAEYNVYAGLAASYAQLGRDQEAKRTADEVKRRWPFFTIASFAEQWKDEKSRQHIAEGLRKAGLT
ncbi:adenylate/guanylate cyclase domain-containing protein [Rhizobiaceae bacterium n13]|uniref:Adenylate/guanylate cyclase domain-containing protein n=1 Tax=Ferirhizobium litorale TaxID=2927786 RepID=A0AAE3U2M5_9HYPH|nr:tetratricopeptide repeat protein [Fererhizobium litorale]MDI7861376.1 adenylate/guanylate cyclase domain-containing protein [Fererhizobium litorale]MDI7921523.1 adenylate/guanylate cyclase domain-containing protein [Fererhizobium litorale]